MNTGVTKTNQIQLIWIEFPPLVHSEPSASREDTTGRPREAWPEKSQSGIVVVVVLFNVKGKQLWSCRDAKLT